MIVRIQGSLLLTLDSSENRDVQSFHAFPQFYCDFTPRLFNFCVDDSASPYVAIRYVTVAVKMNVFNYSVAVRCRTLPYDDVRYVNG